MQPIPGILNFTLTRTSTFEGEVFVIYDEADALKNLTGWIAHAEVRKNPSGTVIIDLNPSVTNGAGGEVTIPEITDENTAALPLGGHSWDLILEDAAGKRHGPYLAGTFKISDPVTQP